jgi:hypothetical protein
MNTEYHVHLTHLCGYMKQDKILLPTKRHCVSIFYTACSATSFPHSRVCVCALAHATRLASISGILVYVVGDFIAVYVQ